MHLGVEGWTVMLVLLLGVEGGVSRSLRQFLLTTSCSLLPLFFFSLLSSSPQTLHLFTFKVRSIPSSFPSLILSACIILPYSYPPLPFSSYPTITIQSAHLTTTTTYHPPTSPETNKPSSNSITANMVPKVRLFRSHSSPASYLEIPAIAPPARN